MLKLESLSARNNQKKKKTNRIFLLEIISCYINNNHSNINRTLAQRTDICEKTVFGHCY